MQRQLPPSKKMKILVFAALIAAASAFPADERRSKRGAAFGVPEVVVAGGSGIIKGPSGVIVADTGAAAAPTAGHVAPVALASPYVGPGYPAHGSGAVIVGPSAGSAGYVKTAGHLFY